MEFFFNTLYSSPFFYIGAFFSICAAFAFLIFLRGFLSGIAGVFTQEAHAGHHKEHRLRVVWGFVLLIFIFVVWEIVRWVAGLF